MDQTSPTGLGATDRRPGVLRAVATFLLVVGVTLAGGRSWTSSALPAPHVGVVADGLATCPPGCLSSSASVPAPQRIEPLVCGRAVRLSFPLVGEALTSMDRVDLVHAGQGYVHATARSEVFRLIHDVELLADVEAGVVHLRVTPRAGPRVGDTLGGVVDQLRVRAAAACATAP